MHGHGIPQTVNLSNFETDVLKLSERSHLGRLQKIWNRQVGFRDFVGFYHGRGVAVSERYHFPETESKEFDRRLFWSGTQKFPDSVVARTIFSKFLPCTKLVEIYVVCQSPPRDWKRSWEHSPPPPPRNINYLWGS